VSTVRRLAISATAAFFLGEGTAASTAHGAGGAEIGVPVIWACRIGGTAGVAETGVKKAVKGVQNSAGEMEWKNYHTRWGGGGGWCRRAPAAAAEEAKIGPIYPLSSSGLTGRRRSGSMGDEREMEMCSKKGESEERERK
jgi:hypothetical protein